MSVYVLMCNTVLQCCFTLIGPSSFHNHTVEASTHALLSVFPSSRADRCSFLLSLPLITDESDHALIDYDTFHDNLYHYHSLRFSVFFFVFFGEFVRLTKKKSRTTSGFRKNYGEKAFLLMQVIESYPPIIFTLFIEETTEKFAGKFSRNEIFSQSSEFFFWENNQVIVSRFQSWQSSDKVECLITGS